MLAHERTREPRRVRQFVQRLQPLQHRRRQDDAAHHLVVAVDSSNTP